MERIEIRAIIKWYNLKGKTVSKIKSKLDAVLGDKAPAMGTIHKWVSEFKKGRVGCEDESRSGRPIDVTTPQVISEIVRIVTNDRSINVRDLGNMVSASYGRVHNILQQHLKIKKISGEWTALELSTEQMAKRIEISSQSLAIQQKSPSEFGKRFLSFGSTWIRPKYAVTMDTNDETKEPATKMPKLNPRTPSSNILITMICDASSLLVLNFHGFNEVKEINTQHYIEFLERLRLTRTFQEKQNLIGNTAAQLFIVQFDGAGIFQISNEFVEKLKEFQMELLPYCADSVPDLMMTTSHIFPNLRKWLEGRKFFNAQAFEEAVREYFRGLGPGYYQDGLAKVESNWQKCIELNGEYVNK